jgi:hypothetical protein
MSEKVWKDNRIVIVLSDEEKEEVETIKAQTAPSNRNIIKILNLILDAVTEGSGKNAN